MTVNLVETEGWTGISFWGAGVGVAWWRMAGVGVAGSGSSFTTLVEAVQVVVSS